MIPAKIIVRIDWNALVRGFPVSGELCEVSGIGPVPVSVVRAMIATGDPFVAGVVTKGVDVANVAHLGRRATAHQVTALEWRDPVCPVLGCNQMANLEIDHREDWAKTKVTLLSWLDRPCDHHHDKKTWEGWAFVPGVGKRPMVAPDDPRHPRNRLGTRPVAGPPTAADGEPEPEPEGNDEAADDGASRAA